MRGFLAVVGIGLEAGAWWRVSRGGSVWLWLAPLFAFLGVTALIAGPPPWSPEVDASTAVLGGIAIGIALYLATRVFFLIAGRSDLLLRQSLAMYRRRGALSVGAAVALSVAVSVPGEELFWREFVQLELVNALGGAALPAALLTWSLFVFANLFSRNLAIVAGAVVGGAVWCGLFWWTGGIAASLTCHVAWTALMLAFPVVRVPSDVAA